MFSRLIQQDHAYMLRRGTVDRVLFMTMKYMHQVKSKVLAAFRSIRNSVLAYPGQFFIIHSFILDTRRLGDKQRENEAWSVVITCIYRIHAILWFLHAYNTRTYKLFACFTKPIINVSFHAPYNENYSKLLWQLYINTC